MSAFNRLGDVDDIADVVAVVASDGARWITDQNIRVNEGCSASRRCSPMHTKRRPDSPVTTRMSPADEIDRANPTTDGWSRP